MEHGYRFDRAVISDRARLAREARERLEKAAPDLLEAYKELLALWRDAQAKCILPQCSVCTKNRTLAKKFSDIIAKAENP